jgi:serine/threonine protein phosphatase PrpC
MNLAPMPLSVRVGAASHAGRVRTDNQDRMSRFRSPLGEVFIVADGMGGHQGGSTAAQMVVSGFEKYLRAPDVDLTVSRALQAAASRVNEEIHGLAHSGNSSTAQMGATAVMAIVQGCQLVIAHAGDCRAYLVRGGQLQRLTKDHTLVQQMLDHGMLTPEQAREHPDGNVVTKAFGKEASLDLAISAPVNIGAGDRILLCSDGLSGYLSDEIIVRTVVAGQEPQVVTDALIAVALDAGGEDNVSIQLLVFSNPPVRPQWDSQPVSSLEPALRLRQLTKFWDRSRRVGGAVLISIVLFLAGLGLHVVWSRFRSAPGTSESSLEEVAVKGNGSQASIKELQREGGVPLKELSSKNGGVSASEKEVSGSDLDGTYWIQVFAEQDEGECDDEIERWRTLLTGETRIRRDSPSRLPRGSLLQPGKIYFVPAAEEQARALAATINLIPELWPKGEEEPIQGVALAIICSARKNERRDETPPGSRGGLP